MDLIRSIALAWCFALASMGLMAGASAQAVQPPYPTANYPSRAAALAACEADMPASVAYLGETPPKYTVVSQQCYESPLYGNYFYAEFVPLQTYFDAPSNVYQLPGYVGPLGMPVYSIFPLTYNCANIGGNTGIPASVPCVPYTPVKNLGCNCENGGRPPPPNTGNPINVATGNKFQSEQDFVSDGLPLVRYYNSDPNGRSAYLGIAWLTTYDRSLSTTGNTNQSTATVARPDGHELTFTKANGVWSSDSDVADQLTEIDNADGSVASWKLFIAGTRQIETYSSYGVLQTISDEDHQLAALSYTVGTELSTTGTTLPGGLIATVTDAHGRILSFAYDNLDRIASVTLPDGGVIKYTYNTADYLSSVSYPDGSARQYLYDETAESAAGANQGKLTGIVDESGVRYGTYGYQADGRAISTQHGQGADLHTVSYAASGMGSTVTYPDGISSTLSFSSSIGTMKTTGVSAPCGPTCGQPNAAATFDANGYPASTIDFNGNLTTTTYDANGLLDQQVEASGTASQRATTTTWNTALRVPLTRVVQNNNGNTVASTTWVYNSTGQTLARCEIDPTNSAATGYTCGNTGSAPVGVRRWTYTYCTAVDTVQCPIIGLLLTATGPRTDLTQTTTYSYYLTDSATAHHGDLQSVTDALGHTTTYLSYDGAGRVLSQQDANGVTTAFTYYPRGWLKTRSVGGATTTYTYTAYGAVATVTDPDNVTVTYGYDTAHRLTTIADAQGNYVQYTLDASGNRTSDNTYAAGGSTPSRSLTRQYNNLGQLIEVTDGLGHVVFNASASGSYDANGNLVQSADANGYQTQQNYDALNRLAKTIANYNGTDAATQNTTTVQALDALDRLTGITDPSSLTTTYGYDGLSNATSLQSPDTGTSSSTYDAAGNRLTHTDAKGVVSSSTYNALDRPTGTSYSDSAQTNDNVTYTYDETNSVTGCVSSNPIGRLTRIVENAVTTVYCYDTRGNITRKQQITSMGTDTTTYTYTAANRLSGVTYPSGTQAGYTFDTDGRVQSVTLTPAGGSANTVVSSISYLPLGPISSYVLGNGQTITRSYDANYALSDLASPALNLHFARDVMGNINAEGNASGATPAAETYSYDPLYRLTGISQGSTSIEALTYNPTGDRTSKTGGGLATGAYGYNSGTHQLTSTGSAAWIPDANGNTTANASGGQTWGYGYNGRNRLTVVQSNGAAVGTYTYNAIGERIQKVATLPTAITQRFDYDEARRLIGEYGSNTRDYVWLGGMLVATVDTSGSATTVSYVVADHLGTPRVVTDGSGNTLWTWSFVGNPFGELAPTSTSGYTLNLRYPGQYYDAESGLVSNGFRDCYEPTIGRYCQSDPAGLNGGISTYAYVGGNPLSHSDPLGLQEYDPAEDLNDEIEPWAMGRLGPTPAPAPETEAQRDFRLGQCPRPNELPKDDSQLKHIFRDDDGHLPNNYTNQNRILNLTNNADNMRGPDKYDNTVYTAPVGDGSESQLWATTRNGVIQNAGLNLTPWTYIPNVGLVPGK